MTVYDFCDLYIESSGDVKIWSANQEGIIFEGTYSEAQRSDLAEFEVETFEVDNGIVVINIE